MISSLSNPAVRRVRRLRKSLWRERERRFVVEGHRDVRAALDAGGTLYEVFCTSAGMDRRPALLEQARTVGAPVVHVAPAVMRSLSVQATAPDVLAVAAMTDLGTVPRPALPMVVLRGVYDPADAGSVLAAAAATGIRSVVAAEATADVFSPSAVRTARGAHFSLAITRGRSTAECREVARGEGGSIMILSPAGPPVWTVPLAKAVCLVVGREDADPILQAETDVVVSIPSRAGSTSLGAQAAIVLYEWVRQAERGR